MTLFLTLVVIVVALQLEGTKDAMECDALPAHASLSGSSLVTCIDLVGRALQQESHQRVSWFENGRPNQHFQLLYRQAIRLLRLKALYELLDFLLLGQEELGRGVFFFKPLASSTRVFSIIN